MIITIKFFLFTCFSLLFIACNNNTPKSTSHTLLIVDEIKVESLSNSNAGSLEQQLRSRQFIFSTCLKEVGSLIPIVDTQLEVSSEQESFSLKTDAKGCLKWSEQLNPTEYTEKEFYTLNRTFKLQDLKESVAIKLNPYIFNGKFAFDTRYCQTDCEQKFYETRELKNRSSAYTVSKTKAYLERIQVQTNIRDNPHNTMRYRVESCILFEDEPIKSQKIKFIIQDHNGRRLLDQPARYIGNGCYVSAFEEKYERISNEVYIKRQLSILISNLKPNQLKPIKMYLDPWTLQTSLFHINANNLNISEQNLEDTAKLIVDKIKVQFLNNSFNSYKVNRFLNLSFRNHFQFEIPQPKWKRYIFNDGSFQPKYLDNVDLKVKLVLLYDKRGSQSFDISNPNNFKYLEYLTGAEFNLKNIHGKATGKFSMLFNWADLPFATSSTYLFAKIYPASKNIKLTPAYIGTKFKPINTSFEDANITNIQDWEVIGSDKLVKLSNFHDIILKEDAQKEPEELWDGSPKAIYINLKKAEQKNNLVLWIKSSSKNLKTSNLQAFPLKTTPVLSNEYQTHRGHKALDEILANPIYLNTFLHQTDGTNLGECKTNWFSRKPKNVCSAISCKYQKNLKDLCYLFLKPKQRIDHIAVENGIYTDEFNSMFVACRRKPADYINFMPLQFITKVYKDPKTDASIVQKEKGTKGEFSLTFSHSVSEGNWWRKGSGIRNYYEVGFNPSKALKFFLAFNATHSGYHYVEKSKYKNTSNQKFKSEIHKMTYDHIDLRLVVDYESCLQISFKTEKANLLNPNLPISYMLCNPQINTQQPITESWYFIKSFNHSNTSSVLDPNDLNNMKISKPIRSKKLFQHFHQDIEGNEQTLILIPRVQNIEQQGLENLKTNNKDYQDFQKYISEDRIRSLFKDIYKVNASKRLPIYTDGSAPGTLYRAMPKNTPIDKNCL